MESTDVENVEESPRTVLLRVMNRFASTSCENEKQKEIIARAGRNYTVVSDERDELAEEITLLQEILMRQEQTYHTDVEEYEKKIENIHEQIQDNGNERKKLEEDMATELTKEAGLKNIMQEYEKTVENMCAERIRVKEDQELEIKTIMDDLHECRKLLSDVEKKFADLHKAYELVKATREGYERQKQQLEYQISQATKLIEQREKGYQSLEELTKKELERAVKELNNVRQNHQIECTKLKGLIRKLDLQIESLEQMIEQQLRENKELTAIYDDCLNKIGAEEQINP